MADLTRGSRSRVDPARLRANLAEVRDELDAAAPGRHVRVLAAVKYVTDDDLSTMADAGIALVGESREQDLAVRAPAHPELEWHFIGHLQSRKVRRVLPHVSLIHSVDSDSVLRQLALHARPSTRVLVEVNVAGEPGKRGIAAADLGAFVTRARGSGIEVAGLMTMPPLARAPEDSRRWFSVLRDLAEAHELPELSMGTSQDFTAAAAEGATIVRLGARLLR